MATQTEAPRDIVRIGLQKSHYVSIEQTKERLHEGVSEVTISALDQAINSAITVVQILKDQNLVKVTKISTGRSAMKDVGKKGRLCDRMEVMVVKTPEFDEIYAEQMKLREEKRAARAAVAAKESEAADEGHAAAEEDAPSAAE